MTYFRHFSCKDMLHMNNVNLDPLTETYGVSFYMHYLAKWPEYFVKAENVAGDLMGYIMGKVESILFIIYLKFRPGFTKVGNVRNFGDLEDQRGGNEM